MIMEHRVMGRMERVEKRKKVCATSSHGDPTPDGFLKVLHQLSSDNSNVTSLGFTYPHACDEVGLVDSHDHFTAFKRLIHPSFGKLEHLGVG